MGAFAAIFGLIGGVITFASIVGIILNAVYIDIDYADKLAEQQMLEYRIEHCDEDIVGNELLYNDIVEFNQDLRHVKKWNKSLWTNWFVNWKIAEIDYIELEGLGKPQ